MRSIGMGVAHAVQVGVHAMVGPAAAVASVVWWEFAKEFFPSPDSLEELGKEDQLALTSNGGFIIPDRHESDTTEECAPLRSQKGF